MDAEEALQVVGLRDGELLLEDPAQVVDQGLMCCGDGKVIDVDAEDDLPGIWAELVEEAGIEG